MPRRDRTILMVDDNPDDVALVRRVLRLADIRVKLCVANDGLEAMEWIDRQGEEAALPDLVLLDLKMPRINGFEFLMHFRADPRTRLVPVVVFTSSNEPSDIRRSLELGANSCVQKTVEFESLSETVQCLARYWLEFHQPLRPEAERAFSLATV